MPTKIPGNITHAELAGEYPDGYAPPIKIHLQEILPGGKAGHFFRELGFWTQVSVSRSIGGKGRATISLSNRDDRFFNNYSNRTFAPEREAAYKAYLRDLHRRCLLWVKEINPLRRRAATFDFQGVRVFDDQTIADYVNFLYNFDGWDGGLAKGGGDPDLVSLGLLQRVIIDAQGPDGLWYALFTGVVSSIDESFSKDGIPVINLVCSDYWRLFDLSEIITQTGADPIADNIQRETTTGLAEESLFRSNSLANFTGPKILQIMMDVVQRTMCWIPYALSKSGQPMPDGRNEGLPASPITSFPIVVSGKTVGNVGPNDFFNHEPFWFVPFSAGSVEPSADYEGANNLRRYARPPTIDGVQGRPSDAAVAAAANALDPLASGIARGANIVRSALNSALADGSEPMDGLPVGQLYSTLLIDKYIQKGLQGLAYAEYIKQILAPWQTNVALGSSIVRRVADSTFYEIIVTTNGDVLYQIPKRNNLPGEYAPSNVTPSTSSVQGTTTGASFSSPVPSQISAGAVTADPTGQNAAFVAAAADRTSAADLAAAQALIGSSASGGGGDAGDSIVGSIADRISAAGTTALLSEGYEYDVPFVDGEYDYSPPPEGFAQKHHGWNYAITDLGLRNARFTSSEEGIVTTVRVPAGQGIIDISPILEPRFFTGRTRLEDTQALVARFGLRATEVQKIFIQNLYGRPLSKELLDRFAQALMNEINGRASGGTLDLSFRPDLDVGKNVFFVERQRLLYGMTITQTVRLGQSADAATTLQLSYAHDITREIFSPFVAVRDLLSSAADQAESEAKALQPTPVAESSGGNPTAGNGISIPAGPPPPAAPIPTPGTAITQIPFFRFTDNVYTQAYIQAVAGVAPLQRDYSSSPGFLLTSSGQYKKTVGKAVYVDRDPRDLVAEAQKTLEAKLQSSFSPITLDEYAMARMITAEAGNGKSVVELIIVAQCLVNQARNARRSVFKHLVARGFSGADPFPDRFGNNDAHAFGSSAVDPTYKSFVVARRVLGGGIGEIIPRVTNVFGLNASKGLKQAARSTLFKWTSANLMWAGNLEGTDPRKFIFLAPRDSATDAKARQKAGQIELFKMLDSFGIAN